MYYHVLADINKTNHLVIDRKKLWVIIAFREIKCSLYAHVVILLLT